MKENITAIASNEPAGADAFRMRFPVDWRSFDPGQFVMVRVPGDAVFLRRPFGIVRLADGLAEICYKVVGKGTRALSRAAAGTEIAAVGPCGRGFRPPGPGETAVLVAGGYGIGPLFGLCERLLGEGRKAVVYYGAKAADQFLYLDELKGLDAAVMLSTEDGSLGFRGMITERLEKDLGSFDRPALYACGPAGLARAVAGIGLKNGLPAQVSMDAYMACGIGVCMGCACKDRDGNFVRACREGPVFDATELKWT